ncbi:MAG: DUF1848 family protein [Candidatus Aminicenantales bacterium]
MKKIVSASRRTDLVAFFPDWLARVFREEKARIIGPRGRAYEADLTPSAVHTVVLWSKDFSHLIGDAHGIRRAIGAYDQIYLLFTVTGLGGTFIEKGAPSPAAALAQLPALVSLAGNPKRVSLRFDPVVFWREESAIKNNLHFFAEAAERAACAGIEDIRISFAQWYGKGLHRARKNGFDYVDPGENEKIDAASSLAETAHQWKLSLHACSQNFLTRVPGIRASACIDGKLLRDLHPRKEEASTIQDKSQRDECGCTESVDIGSYTQACPHGCLYCYANPNIAI